MTVQQKHLFGTCHFAILGLGNYGLHVAQRLLRWGATLYIYDDNAQMRAQACTQLKAYLDERQQCICAPLTTMLAHHDVTALLPSPGIDPSHPVIQAFKHAHIPILCDGEILQIALKKLGRHCHFIGITGTNGKSTTTTLLGHILKVGGYNVAIGGNLGPCALSLPLLPNGGCYVLEMSSYMLEMVQNLHFNGACLLNITPDHLKRHKTMTRYAAAKAHIFDHQQPQDASVIGIDDPFCREIAQQLRHHHLEPVTISAQDKHADYYGLTQPAQAVMTHTTPIAIHNPSLTGAHNRQNCAAATALATYFGVENRTIEKAISSFKALPHRQDPFLCDRAIVYIDDSKATNGESTLQALKERHDVVWIGGGESKEEGLEPLGDHISHIKHAFLYGQDRDKLADTLARHGIAYTVGETLADVVPQACKFAQTHHLNTVLFSPACASFDQYNNFMERGEHFKSLVHHYLSLH